MSTEKAQRKKNNINARKTLQRVTQKKEKTDSKKTEEVQQTRKKKAEVGEGVGEGPWKTETGKTVSSN